jgi:hypothetical protein
MPHETRWQPELRHAIATRMPNAQPAFWPILACSNQHRAICHINHSKRFSQHYTSAHAFHHPSDLVRLEFIQQKAE